MLKGALIKPLEQNYNVLSKGLKIRDFHWIEKTGETQNHHFSQSSSPFKFLTERRFYWKQFPQAHTTLTRLLPSTIHRKFYEKMKIESMKFTKVKITPTRTMFYEFSGEESADVWPSM